MQVPQVSWAIQLPQVCELPYCHAPAQVVVDGPELVPSVQRLLLGHQPHPSVAAQVVQVNLVEQVDGVVGVVGVVVFGVVVVLGVVGVVGMALHWLLLQTHVAHEPVLGPE